jgi:hypothetical protein
MRKLTEGTLWTTGAAAIVLSTALLAHAQSTAPGASGTAPGVTGSTPGQMGTTPGQAGTAPGRAGTTPGTNADLGTRSGTNADMGTRTGTNGDMGTRTGTNADLGTRTGTNTDSATNTDTRTGTPGHMGTTPGKESGSLIQASRRRHLRRRRQRVLPQRLPAAPPSAHTRESDEHPHDRMNIRMTRTRTGVTFGSIEHPATPRVFRHACQNTFVKKDEAGRSAGFS